MGPLIPLFWTPCDVFSGLQSQTGQTYSHLADVYLCVTHYSLRFTSGVTPINLLIPSVTARPISSTYSWAVIGQGSRLGPITPQKNAVTTELCQPSQIWNFSHSRSRNMWMTLNLRSHWAKIEIIKNTSAGDFAFTFAFVWCEQAQLQVYNICTYFLCVLQAAILFLTESSLGS